jgi:hypothetical protein
MKSVPAISRGSLAIWLATTIALSAVHPALAIPVPCGGGTLAITATSDTPLTLPTFNVGQRAQLTASTSGFTATSFSWTIAGPANIKDYNEDLGTQQLGGPPAVPLPWSTTPLTPGDLALPALSFYWKPSAAQIHPLSGGPEPRLVTLEVTPTSGPGCITSETFMIERNTTDVARQPEDFYTSNHRAPTEMNPQLGHVIDEHMYWHTDIGGGAPGTWPQFLAWHGYFLRRFDQWRAEFGYPPVAPWYPGRPLPTGPDFDHTPRLASFDPDANRIPTNFTLAGNGTPGSALGDFASLDSFSNFLEGSYHGNVHCNIGPGGFGGMCDFSSPKDPIFWRWHGFIDVLYRNYCGLKGLTCHSSPGPAADPWMADNPADIAAGGTVPSPSPRWISPDVWNRLGPVTTDSCIPRMPPPHLNTVGGVTRNCGSEADHENPVANVENYLYATLRNTGPTPMRNVYAEVAVYIAPAATGLSWPADFTMLPETRQFINLHLEPGQVTAIGPLPWIPPVPTPSDHFCLYLRVLSVQESPPVEGPNIDTNVANSNSIVWRNVTVVESGKPLITKFIVRNIRDREERLALDLELPPAMLQRATVLLRLDASLRRAFERGQGTVEGLRFDATGLAAVVSPRARIAGLLLAPRDLGTVEVAVQDPIAPVTGELRFTQHSSAGVDGGVIFRVVEPRQPGAKADLQVKLTAPLWVKAGGELAKVGVEATNRGDAAAPGTTEAGSAGYFIDLVLSKDRSVPPGFAIFSETFHEDVLLRGGRVSNTTSLAPGQSATYRPKVVLPRDTPPGKYCLFAVVDSGQQIAESSEINNAHCHEILVKKGLKKWLKK